MKWDKTANLVLLFIFLGFLALFLFPPVIQFGAVTQTDEISQWYVYYGIVYAVIWIALIVYSTWKRKWHFLLGSLVFAALVYLPEWILPRLASDPTEEKSLLTEIMNWFFRGLYSVMYAAQGGLAKIMSQASVQTWTKRIVPLFIAAYVATQVVRYYRNAYISQQLQMNKSVRHENPDLAKELGQPVERKKITGKLSSKKLIKPTNAESAGSPRLGNGSGKSARTGLPEDTTRFPGNS